MGVALRASAPGLEGPTENSVELTRAPRGPGVGRELVLSDLDHIESDEPVFPQVAPGSAASLRMLLACDFVPIGMEVLIQPG